MSLCYQKLFQCIIWNEMEAWLDSGVVQRLVRGVNCQQSWIEWQKMTTWNIGKMLCLRKTFVYLKDTQLYILCMYSAFIYYQLTVTTKVEGKIIETQFNLLWRLLESGFPSMTHIYTPIWIMATELTAFKTPPIPDKHTKVMPKSTEHVE